MTTGEGRPAARTAWLLQAALVGVTIILVLQNTKQAMLPRTQTPTLWAAEIVSIACMLVLRSGWGRDNAWRAAQGDLGTIANNYYEPRRHDLSAGFAIGVAVLGGLWWGLATWDVVFTGMRRGVATRGLLDFEVAAIVGTLAGGILGATIGLAVGHVWETRHRRRRLEQRSAHA